jgi:8-oxo-dGTP pyrophosphatase MutT (NUDIX family)
MRPGAYAVFLVDSYGRTTFTYMFTAIAHARKRTADLLVLSGNRFLVLQRAPGTRDSGTWSLPGGQPEPGEPGYAAALRGTQRELGRVPPHLLLGEAVVERGRRRHDVFACRTARERRAHLRLSLSDEFLAWRWVSMKWASRNARRLHPVLRALVEDDSGRQWLHDVVARRQPDPEVADRRHASRGVRAVS